MFIFNLTYIKPILEVERVLPEHISPHYSAGKHKELKRKTLHRFWLLV